MISTIYWKNLLAVQWMSTSSVEFKKVFQEREQGQQQQQKFIVKKPLDGDTVKALRPKITIKAKIKLVCLW